MADDRKKSGCKEVSGLLALYHYGELGGAEKALVEEHISACSVCGAELEELGRMLSGITPEEPHPFAVSRSVNRVKARIRRHRKARWLTGLVPAGLAAAIAIMVTAIYFNVNGVNNGSDYAMNTGTAVEKARDGFASTDEAATVAEDTADEDEELLLVLLEGPPAEPEGALAPHGVIAADNEGAVKEEEPPIYALVEMEPLDDKEVIEMLDLLEDYDTLEQLQESGAGS